MDREPQPSDGPDYHADHAAWERHQLDSYDGYDRNDPKHPTYLQRLLDHAEELKGPQ